MAIKKIVGVCLITAFFIVSLISASSETFEADYFTNASLPCNFTKHNLTYPGLQVPFKKYWILPNATILPDTFPGDDKYTLTVTPYDLRLFIRNIDDPDFGVYHCIMIWNNVDYKMDAIRVGLNEHGPYYQKKLQEFERNVIIGCSGAGGLVFLILIGCVVCNFMNRRKKHREDPVPSRDISVYSIDKRNKQKLNTTYGYEINAEDDDNETVGSVTHDASDEQYACVNKASVRATRGDQVTLQTAHL